MHGEPTATRAGHASRSVVDSTPVTPRAARLRDADGLGGVELVESRIESVPLPDGIADCVVSNGALVTRARRRRPA